MGWPTGIEPVIAGPQPAVITVSPWPPCDSAVKYHFYCKAYLTAEPLFCAGSIHDFTPFDKGFKRLLPLLYMKKLIAASAALILLGQGCLSGAGAPRKTALPTPIPKPAEVVESPSATKTELTIIPPEDWTQFEHAGVPNFSFYYPGTQATGTALMGLDRGELAVFELPSNAVITTQTSYPQRSMAVTVFSEDSEYVNGCYYNLLGAETTGDTQDNVPPVRINERTWCISESTEGAAGNVFHETAYATNIGTQVVVFHFTVRSSTCAAFDNPATQCILYDEARDTSDFREIIKTFVQ